MVGRESPPECDTAQRADEVVHPVRSIFKINGFVALITEMMRWISNVAPISNKLARGLHMYAVIACWV